MIKCSFVFGKMVLQVFTVAFLQSLLFLAKFDRKKVRFIQLTCKFIVLAFTGAKK